MFWRRKKKREPALIELLDAFVNAPSLLDARQILERSPALMSAEAESILANNVASLREQGHTAAAEHVASYITILRQSRSEGLDVAFREAASANPEPPPELLPLLSEAYEAERSFEASGNPTALDAAARAWERALMHPAFATAAPRIRSLTANEAGSVMMRRFVARGDRADLDAAIRLWTRTAEEAVPDDPALPMLLSNLAGGLVSRHRTSRAREDLDLAIEHLTRAEGIASISDSAIIVSGLAAALDARHQLTGDATDLERALALARRALAAAGPGSPDRAAHLNNLGALLDRRFSLGGEVADLDTAIDTLRESIALTAPGAPQRPGRLQTLGRALTARHKATGRLEDLESAIEALAASVDATATDAPQLPARLHDLGSALLPTHRLTQRRDVIRRAIEAFEQSVALTRDDAPELPARLGGLAAARIALSEASEGDSELLDGAIEAIERARVLSSPGSESPVLLTTLGNALTLRFRRRGARADLDRAIEALEEAATSADNESPDLPSFLSNLAVALRLRHDVGGDARDLDQAREVYRRGIETAERVNPDSRLVLARNWAIGASERGSWEEAADAFEQAIETAEALYAPHVVGAHKETLLQRFGDLPADAAYALARAGRIDRAVEALERGRARFLSEAIDRGRVDPGELPGLDLIVSAAAIEPIVYIVVSDRGGAAFIVADDRVRAVWLDQVTDPVLRERLSAYGRAYEHRHLDPGASMDALDALARWTWDVVMGPIVAELASAQSVVLVPIGLLGLLPLQAAWTIDGSAPSGRRYALDALRLSFAPNARSLIETRRRAERDTPDSALVVADPGGGAGPLPYSEDEAREVAAAFARSESLVASSATRVGVLARLPHFPVAHLSCHATADVANPRGGALQLADGSLTMADLVEAKLEHTRLIVLSACETALVSTALPDEVIGFSSVLLRAGAAGVVGSMWAVPEVGTLLVMACFHALWRDGECLDPAEALRRAQCWVRDATNGEKRERFPAIAELSGAGVPDRARSFWSGARAHSHPYHWAAFIYVGA
jgi:CHAT domain-containing protein/tetratricopeptide (TPR) repeat protein